MKKMPTKLTLLEWSAIAAIRMQAASFDEGISAPGTYTFRGDERRLAERMRRKRLLRPMGKRFPGQYRITDLGTRLYNK